MEEYKFMRGGKRKGAGRPAGTTKPANLKRETINIRLPKWIIEWLLDQPQSAGRIIELAIRDTFSLKPPSE